MFFGYLHFLVFLYYIEFSVVDNVDTVLKLS